MRSSAATEMQSAGLVDMQASVHVDNWLALEAGQSPYPSSEAKSEDSESDVREYVPAFYAKKRFELRRLRHMLAKGERPVSKVKFLGCTMEVVRDHLPPMLNEAPFGEESIPSCACCTNQSPIAGGRVN